MNIQTFNALAGFPWFSLAALAVTFWAMRVIIREIIREYARARVGVPQHEFEAAERRWEQRFLDQKAVWESLYWDMMKRLGKLERRFL